MRKSKDLRIKRERETDRETQRQRKKERQRDSYSVGRTAETCLTVFILYRIFGDNFSHEPDIIIISKSYLFLLVDAHIQINIIIKNVIKFYIEIKIIGEN